MKTHCRKIAPEHFTAVRDGDKRAELRSEDEARFVAGDRLHLREWLGAEYSGRCLSTTICHVLRDSKLLAPGVAMLSISTPSPCDGGESHQ